jgi:hypothetical protein
MIYYEEIPRGYVDTALRDKECKAVAFVRNNLNMPEIPIYYVRRLPSNGGGRKHFGKVFEFEPWPHIEFDSLLGLAVFDKNMILINTDHCNKDNIINIVLHEYRHFYHHKQLVTINAMEYDSCRYAEDGEYAMYGYAKTNKDFYRIVTA